VVLKARGRLASLLFLILPLAVVLAINLRVDASKPLTFDEIVVSKTALLPHVSSIWKLLNSGQSPHPPLNFLLVRLVYAVFGVSDLTTRIPSTVWFLAMEISVFALVTRRSHAAFGALAMLLPLSTAARIYAADAKPYGAMLGCAGLALLSWTYTKERKYRLAALAGLGLSIACAVSSHFFGALLAVPVLAGELVRTVRRRRADWAVYAVTICGLVPLGFYRSIIQAGKRIHMTHPWQESLGPGFALSAPDALLAGAAVPILCALAIAAGFRMVTGERENRSAIPGDELVAVSALAMLPLIAVCAGPVVGLHAVVDKYVISMVVGVAVLVGWSASALAGQRVAAGILMAAIACIWGCRDFERDLRSAASARETLVNFALPPEVAKQGTLPIVIESQLYFELSRYARRGTADRLYLLLDPAAANRYLHSDAAQQSMLLDPGYFGAHVERLADFRASHRELLIYELVPEDMNWMLRKYRDAGARVELLAAGESDRWYRVTE
jgi:4-amino-4-deoxy-L-arabinose transferase-like glycosyltransferase